MRNFPKPMLNDVNTEKVSSVLTTLKNNRLFRYDGELPEQSEVSILEREFAQRVGTKYAIAMNSCSSALFVSLLCAGIQTGDKVAIPAFTFIAVPSAVVHAGAVPVLIEVNEDYVMDLDDFTQHAKSGKIKVLLLSYMRGRVPDLDKVIEICQRYDIVLIEDAAHSLGVLYHEKQTGTFGMAGCFSMQSYKMIDSGEGGMLITDDKAIALRAILYSGCYEMNWKKHFAMAEHEEELMALTNTIPAYNFRMSNLSAAVLIPQLSEIENRVARYNQIYQKLSHLLSRSKVIRIPVFNQDLRYAADSIQWQFIGLTVDQISQILTELKQQDIKIDGFFGGNARSFWNWKFFQQQQTCSNTRKLITQSVDMRLSINMTETDIEKMAGQIIQCCESHSLK